MSSSHSDDHQNNKLVKNLRALPLFSDRGKNKSHSQLTSTFELSSNSKRLGVILSHYILLCFPFPLDFSTKIQIIRESGVYILQCSIYPSFLPNRAELLRNTTLYHPCGVYQQCSRKSSIPLKTYRRRPSFHPSPHSRIQRMQGVGQGGGGKGSRIFGLQFKSMEHIIKVLVSQS